MSTQNHKFLTEEQGFHLTMYSPTSNHGDTLASSRNSTLENSKEVNNEEYAGKRFTFNYHSMAIANPGNQLLEEKASLSHGNQQNHDSGRYTKSIGSYQRRGT